MTALDTSVAVVDVVERAPGAGEITVAVEAASINGIDVSVAAGQVWDYLPYTLPVVLGRDFGGTVAAIGAGVDSVRVGDRVAGAITALELGAGSIAERIVVPAGSVTAIPAGVSAIQAAAVGLAGVTATDGLAALELKSDDVVLVSGATGGVGALAVQLALSRGARVVATARPGAATEFVHGLGMCDVVDYRDDTARDLAALTDTNGVQAVLHAAGDAASLGRVLARGGRFASLLGANAEQVGRDDVTVIGVLAAFTPKKLADLLALVANGELQVPVAATFGLADATDALEQFSRGKLGKIVVTVP